MHFLQQQNLYSGILSAGWGIHEHGHRGGCPFHSCGQPAGQFGSSAVHLVWWILAQQHTHAQRCQLDGPIVLCQVSVAASTAASSQSDNVEISCTV